MNTLLTRAESSEMDKQFTSGMQVKRRGRPPKGIALEVDGVMTIGRFPDHEQISHWAYRLELANAMKAGLMDSESRHDEVAKQRASIIESVIAEMRAL